MGRSAQEAEEQPERQGGNQETVREAKGRGSRRRLLPVTTRLTKALPPGHTAMPLSAG